MGLFGLGVPKSKLEFMCLLSGLGFFGEESLSVIARMGSGAGNASRMFGFGVAAFFGVAFMRLFLAEAGGVAKGRV